MVDITNVPTFSDIRKRKSSFLPSLHLKKPHVAIAKASISTKSQGQMANNEQKLVNLSYNLRTSYVPISIAMYRSHSRLYPDGQLRKPN